MEYLTDCCAVFVKDHELENVCPHCNKKFSNVLGFAEDKSLSEDVDVSGKEVHEFSKTKPTSDSEDTEKTIETKEEDSVAFDDPFVDMVEIKTKKPRKIRE